MHVIGVALSMPFYDDTAQSVHIYFRYTILGHLFHSPFFLSISLSFSPPPPNSPIYHSLSYPPHRLNSLKWKERKGGKEGERDEEGMREREIYGGVLG